MQDKTEIPLMFNEKIVLKFEIFTLWVGVPLF